MFKRVLVPLDRSSLAEQVLAHLPWLAPADQTEITLVSVVEPWHYYYGSADPNPLDWFTVRKYVQEYLEKQRATLEQMGYSVSLQIGEDDPAKVISEVAQDGVVDLIAISTHGRSGFIRWALGSVAERVIHGTRVPIFLVRENTPVPTGENMHILVPLDGSKLAEQALAYASAIAMRTKATMLLLRVLDTHDGENSSMFFEDKMAVNEMMAQWQTGAQTYLDDVAQGLRASGAMVETRVVPGEPNTVIGEVSAQEDIDLVVMNSHGRSGLSRWVYGSTANKVLRSVDCPLLLIRATWPDAQP